MGVMLNLVTAGLRFYIFLFFSFVFHILCMSAHSCLLTIILLKITLCVNIVSLCSQVFSWKFIILLWNLNFHNQETTCFSVRLSPGRLLQRSGCRLVLGRWLLRHWIGSSGIWIKVSCGLPHFLQAIQVNKANSLQLRPSKPFPPHGLSSIM